MKPPWKGEEKVKQLNNKTIMNFYDFLLPICICVILPVMIVWFVSRARQNETNRKAEIMLKAIEKGQSIDPEIFKSPRKKSSIKQDLLDKLNGACITTLMGAAFLLLYIFKVTTYGFASFLPYAGGAMLAVGIGLFVSYFAGKKMLAKEIEAEEKELLERK